MRRPVLPWGWLVFCSQIFLIRLPDLFWRRFASFQRFLVAFGLSCSMACFIPRTAFVLLNINQFRVSLTSNKGWNPVTSTCQHEEPYRKAKVGNFCLIKAQISGRKVELKKEAEEHRSIRMACQDGLIFLQASTGLMNELVSPCRQFRKKGHDSLAAKLRPRSWARHGSLFRVKLELFVDLFVGREIRSFSVRRETLDEN